MTKTPACDGDAGPCVVKSLRKNLAAAFLDCHLMVTNPEAYVAELAAAGASQFTFHVESTGACAVRACSSRSVAARRHVSPSPGSGVSVRAAGVPLPGRSSLPCQRAFRTTFSHARS